MSGSQAIPTGEQPGIPLQAVGGTSAATAPVPAPAPAPAPAPQAQPQAAPQQAAQPQGAIAPVSQSDPTPPIAKPPLDPRPYALLAENAPQYRAMVDQVAKDTGVSPDRLAWHWWKEGGFQTQVPDGKAGEQGPMQVMPTTGQQFNPHGALDPTKLEDNMTLAGRYIHQLDTLYGKDSPSSVGAYQGGEGSVNDIAAHPDVAAKNHPKTLAYAQSAFPGAQVGPSGFVGQSNMNAPDLVKAAVQGGPDGALRYMAQTAPAGMGMTDVMRQAEGTLVGYFAMRGDVAGMQHARDFFLQISHTGSNQNLMAAQQALQTGDGVGAAQYLAKAHAFFPDSTMGQFGVDQKGQVWARRMDEHDPSRQLGPAFQVTPDSVTGVLNQTTDPGKYLQTVLEQRKQAAYERNLQVQGQYHADMLQEHYDAMNTANQTRQDGLQERAKYHEEELANRKAALAIEAGRAKSGDASLSRTADKEADDKYNELAMPDTPLEQRGQMSEIYHNLRMNGVTGPQAEAVTQGLIGNKMHLLRTTDGNYAVAGKDGQPQAYISKALGDRLAGGKTPQPKGGAQVGGPPGASTPGPSPIGAGASSSYARGMGVNQDLTGTVMPPAPSSALPPPTVH